LQMLFLDVAWIVDERCSIGRSLNILCSSHPGSPMTEATPTTMRPRANQSLASTSSAQTTLSPKAMAASTPDSDDAAG